MTSEARSYSNIESKIEEILEEVYSEVGKDFDYYSRDAVPVYFFTTQTFSKFTRPGCSRNV